MKKIVPQDAILIPDQAEKVFSGVIFDVYQWQQDNFDGSKATFEMLKRADTVTAIAIADDKILTIEDTQPHVGTRLGFPGGRVDEEDGDTLSAIKREVLEETGYQFENWKLIQVIQPHPKLEWFVYAYLAWEGKKVTEPHLDVGEKIKLNLVDFAQLKQLSTDKSTYLNEANHFFKDAADIQRLIDTPQYQGKEVDR
jgi:ADP-ribose pyrophosphatase